MQFTIDIPDPAKLAGITFAREAYNAALPEEYVEVEGARVAVTPKPGTLATDAEYVQFVMDKAAESYARQHGGAA
jgi:hypothetical protein